MKKLNNLERLKEFWSHLGRGFLAFWQGFGEGAGSRNTVTEPKRRQNPKRPPRSSFLPNGSSIFENALAIGILIFGLAAATACHAQNGLMLTTVANFDDTNGFDEYPELMQGTDGMLYGVTQWGGDFNLGTVFSSSLSGSLNTLVSLNGTNGVYPSAPPVQAADGNFYGTTLNGGADWTGWGGTNGNIFGTIYRMDSNGVLTTIFSFNQTNGAGPGVVGGLIMGNDGALYGVTQQGGPNFTNINYGDGTVFKITTNGDFTLLANFNGTNGVLPVDIIQASDGNFYGTTESGGIDETNGFGGIGFGTVFQMTPNGQINSLVQFNGTNGWEPTGIMQASDGCLYGTTSAGGKFYTGDSQNNGYGTVFKITTNGDFTLLASFDGTNGAQPKGRLIEVCNGLFYGTAYTGGLYPGGPGFFPDYGTFFQITTNGDLTALLSFSGDSLMPAWPLSTLLKASDGNYYGTAQIGTGPTNSSGNPISYPGAIFCVRPVQAPVLQAVAQAGQLNLNWNAWAGYSYNVMYETNLAGSNWNLLSTVTAQTNGMTSVSDSIGPDTQRFYSVILQLH